MTIGSLFAGIGGLELGLEHAGLGPVVWQVEHVPPTRVGRETPAQTEQRARRQTDLHQAVLARHWPNAQRYQRVQDVGAHNLAPVDLLCGGFPCQDLSTANSRRQGLEGARSGLWWEFDRLVGELTPRWVVVENVYQGWRSWVPAVRCALWARGYASVCLRVSAADVGARHRRARGFMVADRDGLLLRVESGRRSWQDRIAQAVARATLAHAGRLRLSGRPENARERAWLSTGAERSGPERTSEPWPGAGGAAEPPLVRDVYGLPSRLARPACYRTDRIRALGNAVVPPCAEAVGYVIKDFEAGRWGQLSMGGGDFNQVVTKERDDGLDIEAPRARGV